MSISLSPSAAKRISGQIAAKPNMVALRFTVKASGCSGHSYVMNLASEVKPNDIVLESRGVQIYTDTSSLELLDGTEIDYVSEGLNQTFKFSNPKAEAHCGCGESFAVTK